MPTASSLRLAAVGEWRTGTWAGETVSFGLSLVLAGYGGQNPVVNGTLGTFNADADGSTVDYPYFVGNIAWKSPSIPLTDLAAAVDAMRDFLEKRQAKWNDELTMDTIHVTALQPNGKVVNGASVYELKSPVTGMASNLDNGPQASQVISFMTAGRGPRNRGRMYTPYHRPLGASTGLISAADTLSGATDGKDLILALRAIPSLEPAVVSRTYQTFSEITSVRCGDELDQQQRRRRKRREVYTKADV